MYRWVHVQGAVSLTLAIIIDEEPLISRHGVKGLITLLDVVFSHLARVEWTGALESVQRIG